MRVGWLADQSSALGGAELTQDEFRRAAPDGVEIVDCPPDGVVLGLDRYVIQNCVTYPLDSLRRLPHDQTVKYWHDVGPHVQPGVRDWLDQVRIKICCSPMQAEYMKMPEDVHTVPPAVNLDRFRGPADERAANGHPRSGNCCVASWRNFGKGWHRVVDWSAKNGPVEFFGGGQLAPPGTREVQYEYMPQLLTEFERFVFLPTVLEPFGRLVAEAWAAGCEIVTNRLVGATYWITEAPEQIDGAADTFWDLVLA